MAPQPRHGWKPGLRARRGQARCGVAAASIPVDGEATILLTKRTSHLPSHKGPGLAAGRRARSRARRSRTARCGRREEEVGVRTDLVTPDGPPDAAAHPGQRVRAEPGGRDDGVAAGDVAEPGEVERIIEVAGGGPARIRARHRRVTRVRDGLEFDMPYFDIDGEEVWGATAMVLAEFVDAAGRAARSLVEAQSPGRLKTPGSSRMRPVQTADGGRVLSPGAQRRDTRCHRVAKSPTPRCSTSSSHAPAEAGGDGAAWPSAGGTWPPSGNWPPAGGRRARRRPRRRARGDRRAARGGAGALPQLRAVGHHLARAARRARRPEAGAAPHPLHDVAAEPDRRRQAPQVREGRRRRDGQLPPARRRRALRDARPHGAVRSRCAIRWSTARATSARSTATAPRRCATPSAASRASATRCCTEIEQDDGRPSGPNYDGTKTEPVVLPARLPNLLVNGATGIAVGMATNIPPHNLGEVCTALIKLLDNEDLTQRAAVPLRQGPGLPDRRPDPQLRRRAEGDLQDRLRDRSGCAARGTSGRRRASTKTIYIDSIPYTVNKAQLVERIADVVLGRKLPPLLDVKDLSTDDVRIALELKKDADEKMVMAYLFKHTPLQINFAVNLTCLIPTENPEVGRPERLDLKQILWHFLHFRLEVVTRRLEHELAALKKRIHILEGFEKVFDALDEIIRIIRKSDGKADAAEKIMKRFELDAEQTDAILELKIYRLARLEILVIRNELEEKRKRARQIGALLKDEDEPLEAGARASSRTIQKTYGDAKADTRRTRIEAVEEVEYSADDFIVEEDNVVIVSRDGWVKRQKEVKDLSTTRLREGDAVLAVLAGSTRATCVFFTQLRRGLHVPHHRRAGVDRLRRADPAAVQVQGRRDASSRRSASIRA